MSAARRTGLLLCAVALVPAAVGLGGSPAQAAPKPRLTVFDATLTEGTGGQAIVAFAVQLSAKAPSAVGFTWGTRAGTAKAGTDYAAVPASTTARIPKGGTSAVLVVRVAADAVDEYTETFAVRIAGTPSSVTVADADATATVLDDDAAPTVSVTPGQVVEGTDQTGPVLRPLTATLSQPSGKPVSLRYAVVSGTALVGSDLDVRSGRLAFPAGVTSVPFQVALDGDAVDEPHRVFGLAWSAPVNVRVPARRTAISLLDDDGPLRPSVLGTTPTGPSPEADPLVYGLAPGGSTVEVYLNGSCSGSPVVSGSAEAFTGAGIAVPMEHNATNTISVLGTDTVGGDDTDCSPSFEYVHDDVAPSAPHDLATEPDSPTTDPDVTFFGVAEAGSSVRVFLDTDCSGTAIATLSAADFQGTGVSLDGLLGADVTHALRADATDPAGNTSACSPALPVLVDTLAPAAPTGLHVVDGLPEGTDVVVGGSAETGSLVQLFVDNACTAGGADSFGTADQFATSGVPVSHSLAEGPHTLYARATDQAGNVGACSAGLPVVVDRTPPGAPTGLERGSPIGSNSTPRLRATVPDGTAVSVTVYRDAGGSHDCDVPVGTGTPSALESTAGIVVGPLPAGVFQLRATTTDSSGYESGCSTSQVTVDNLAPGPPVLVEAVGGSPTQDTRPAFVGSAEAGSQIHLWVDNATCAGPADANGDVVDFGGPGIELTTDLADGVHLVTATATDAAGNESVCSEPLGVTVDTAAPVLGPRGLLVLN